MKTKSLIILSLLLIIIVWGSYITFNKQKRSVVIETTTTTKLALCSNEYFQTEYNENGKIIIKDFPYRLVDNSPTAQCKTNENEETGTGFSTIRCFIKGLSLSNISNLTCIQELELGCADCWSENHKPCIFENDNLNNLSQLSNLELLRFIGTTNNSIDNGWWKNLKKLKEIDVISECHEDNILDDILPVIGNISSIEKVWFSLGTENLTKYHKYNELCTWINTWTNIKTIDLGDSEVTITQDKKFIPVKPESYNKAQYSNCEEWLEGYKNRSFDNRQG